MTHERADQILINNAQKYIAICERGVSPNADTNSTSGQSLDLRGCIGQRLNQEAA